VRWSDNISSFDENDTLCPLSISLVFSDNLTASIVILVVEKCCRSERDDRFISILLIGDQRHKPTNRSLPNRRLVPPVCYFCLISSVFKTKISATHSCFKIIIYLWNTFPCSFNFPCSFQCIYLSFKHCSYLHFIVKHSFLLLKRVKSSKTLRSKIFLSIEQLEISWYIKSERNLAGKSEIKNIRH